VGLVLWTFLAQSVSQASNSLVNSAELIRKVYFPRLLVPTAAVVNALFDLLISIPAVIVLMMVYGVAFSSNVIFAPAMIMIGVFTALGVGIWLAALNVAYRDVRYVVPFVIQLWLFVTPVIYPASFVTDKLNDYGIPAWVYGLNPVAGAVHGLRWAVLGEGPGPWRMVLVSGLVSLIILFFGAVFFRRVERTMADVV
jgi:lipopolysaccharide transport system permease protein